MLSSSTSSSRRPHREKWPYFFLLPTLLLMALVFVYPLITVVVNSFFRGRVGGQKFVGIDNYRILTEDPVFLTSFANSFKLLLTVPITTGLALVVALLLYEGTRGWKPYRVLVFLPYMIPSTAIGLSFSYLLQKEGILNTFLAQVGLDFLALDWLGDENIVIFSVGAVMIWSQVGFGIVIFTASLLSLPHEVTEAAIMDGASRWQRNRMVIVPQIRGTVQFFLALQAIQALAWSFPYVYVITQGGPGSASSVVDLYIFKYAFEFNSVGLSSAAAVVLLVISGVLIFIYSRIRLKQQG